MVVATTTIGELRVEHNVNTYMIEQQKDAIEHMMKLL
jgi:hypothetical protein